MAGSPSKRISLTAYPCRSTWFTVFLMAASRSSLSLDFSSCVITYVSGLRTATEKATPSKNPIFILADCGLTSSDISSSLSRSLMGGLFEHPFIFPFSVARGRPHISTMRLNAFTVSCMFAMRPARIVSTTVYTPGYPILRRMVLAFLASPTSLCIVAGFLQRFDILSPYLRKIFGCSFYLRSVIGTYTFLSFPSGRNGICLRAFSG